MLVIVLKNIYIYTLYIIKLFQIYYKEKLTFFIESSPLRTNNDRCERAADFSQSALIRGSGLATVGAIIICYI